MRLNGLHCTGAVLCFLMFSGTGAQLSVLDMVEKLQTTPQVYPSPLYSFSLCMEIKNRVFNSSLLNSSSLQYKSMYAEVSTVLDTAFNCSNCDTRDTYRGITNMTFSKGSVIANCTIQFQTIFINHVVIKFLFLRAIDNNTGLNDLAINRSYTNQTVTPAWLFQASTAPTVTATPFAEKTARGFPVWAIALLVLACIILLLLLILLILICCWFCRRREKKEEKTTVVVPYERTSFKEHLSNPTYMGHPPETNPNYPVFRQPDMQNIPQPGMYMVNPPR